MGLRDCNRRSADVFFEQAAQLTLADTEPPRKRIDVAAVERAELDQREGARHGVRGAAPDTEIGRGLRPAAQTRAKARLLCCRSRGIEADIGALGRACRTHRPTVDAGRLDADEQASVEAGV